MDVQRQGSNGRGLFEDACHLIENGHKDVFQYGFSYFLRALNEHQRIKSAKMKDMAFATRMAYHADKSEWKKYMRRK